MAKYDRLLYILNLLRARRNLNAAALAEECGVTERSIYRDIVALSEANIPIYYDNGYKLASDNFLPPLNFDYEEYTALKLALDSSPLSRSGRYTEPLKRLRSKLEAMVSESVRNRRRFTPQTTHMHIVTTQEEEKCARFHETVESAAEQCRCLKIRYAGIRSGETERIVEPYFIVFRGRAFYFVAWCRLRREMRTFRLDRVMDLEMLTDTFARREDVDPATYFHGSWEVYSGEPVSVKVRLTGAAARVVRTGCHHPDEEVRQVDENTVIYSVTVRGTEEIMRWLLGFGADAIVLEPASLRQHMGLLGQFLSQEYGNDAQQDG
jgi:predicted DNA-binding transcriptional regulator YafY